MRTSETTLVADVPAIHIQITRAARAADAGEKYLSDLLAVDAINCMRSSTNRTCKF